LNKNRARGKRKRGGNIVRIDGKKDKKKIYGKLKEWKEMGIKELVAEQQHEEIKKVEQPKKKKICRCKNR